MAEYVTVEDVDTTLGADWATEDDKERYVAMANAYLSSLRIRLPSSDVPNDIILAGAELAAAAADDLLYAQVVEGEITSKKVKAGSASVEKSYANLSSVGTSGLPARVQFALALIAGYRAVPMGITVGHRGRYGCA